MPCYLGVRCHQPDLHGFEEGSQCLRCTWYLACRSATENGWHEACWTGVSVYCCLHPVMFSCNPNRCPTWTAVRRREKKPASLSTASTCFTRLWRSCSPASSMSPSGVVLVGLGWGGHVCRLFCLYVGGFMFVDCFVCMLVFIHVCSFMCLFCLQPHPGTMLRWSHAMGGFPPCVSLRRLARAVRNRWSYEEHTMRQALQ